MGDEENTNNVLISGGSFPNPSDKGQSCLEAFRIACKSTVRLVQIKLVYIRYIAEVATLDQTFKIAFGLDMLWPATEKDKKEYSADPKGYEPSYVPNFEFPNCKEVELERRELVTGNPFKVTPEGYNFCRTLVIGTFMEQFELRNYPFDVQDLTVIMDMSFNLKEEALFVPWLESYPLDPNAKSPDDKNFVQLNRAFSAIPDFDARRIVIEFAVRENCWGQMRFRIQMVRIPDGTLGRIASLCCLLGIGTLATFSMSAINDHSDRVGFLITAILAFVAFQFIITSSLPMTPYLTLLDKYTISSFIYLIALLCVLSIIQRTDIMNDEDTAIYVDNCLFFASAAVVAGIQLWFVIAGWSARKYELSKLFMNMRQLDEKHKGKNEAPVNVYGVQLLSDCLTSYQGDPFCSFEGFEKKKN